MEQHPGAVSQPRILSLVGRAVREFQPAQLPGLRRHSRAARERHVRSVRRISARWGGTAAGGGISHPGAAAQQPDLPQQPSAGRVPQSGGHARPLSELVHPADDRRRAGGSFYLADPEPAPCTGDSLGRLLAQEPVLGGVFARVVAPSRRGERSVFRHLPFRRTLGEPAGRRADAGRVVHQSPPARQHAAPGIVQRGVPQRSGRHPILLRDLQRRFARRPERSAGFRRGGVGQWRPSGSAP